MFIVVLGLEEFGALAASDAAASVLITGGFGRARKREGCEGSARSLNY